MVVLAGAIILAVAFISGKLPDFSGILPAFAEAGSSSVLLNTPYYAEITASSAKYGVDPALVAAIISVESGFNPDAVSKSGAQGLMQIMPATGRELGLSDSTDPAQNIDAGTKYISQMIVRFDGDMDKAIMAYHGSPGRIASGGARPIDREYLKMVQAEYDKYRSRKSASSPYRGKVKVTQEMHGLEGWLGIDIKQGCGAMLYAPLTGRVTYNGRDGYAGPHSNGEENTMLTVESGDMSVTMLHGNYSLVSVGDPVVAGITPVGTEAKTGNATGCHTHLIAKKNGQVINPFKVMDIER